jgi:hypothetical protein
LGHFKVIQKNLGKWFSVPWYPIAVSAYPVLALLAANIGQVELKAGLRPLLVSIAFGGLLFFLLWLFLRQVINCFSCHTLVGIVFSWACLHYHR